jgi:hypothetical protein
VAIPATTGVLAFATGALILSTTPLSVGLVVVRLRLADLAFDPFVDLAFDPFADLAFDPFADLAFDPFADRAFDALVDLAFEPFDDLAFEPFEEAVRDRPFELCEAFFAPAVRVPVCAIPTSFVSYSLQRATRTRVEFLRAECARC